MKKRSGNFALFAVVALLGGGSTSLTTHTAFAASDTLGNCSIVMPGQSDNGGNNCGSEFGLAYHGYFADEAPCYGDVSEAIEAMQQNPACQQ